MAVLILLVVFLTQAKLAVQELPSRTPTQWCLLNLKRVLLSILFYCETSKFVEDESE